MPLPLTRIPLSSIINFSMLNRVEAQMAILMELKSQRLNLNPERVTL